MSAPSIKDLLKSRNPLYAGPGAMFHWSAYIGGQDFIVGNLHSHKRENADIFRERQTRAYYLNYLRSLNNLAVDFIFSESIERAGGKQGFLENVNRMGASADNFMRDATLRAIVKGLHFVGADMPRVEGDAPKSRADEREMGVAPYWFQLEREDVLNWDLDDTGKPTWVLTREGAASGATWQDSITVRKSPTERYKVWTRTDWTLYECAKRMGDRLGDPKEVASGSHSFGEIPIFPIYGEKVAEWDGDSWNRDASIVAKALLNVCSLRDEYNYETAIEQIVYPGGNPEQIQDVVRDARYGLTTPQNPELPLPYFLASAGRGAETLRQQIYDLRDEIYRMAKQRIINTSGSADGASGLSKQQDFAATNTTLGGLADEAERVENKLHEIAGTGISAEYPDDFDVAALDSAIDRIIRVDTLDVPDELREVMYGDLTQKIMRGKPVDERNKVLKAIKDRFEAMPDAAVIDAAAIKQVTRTGAANPGNPVGRSNAA